MNTILIAKKEDILNPRLVDCTLPLDEMWIEDMLIPQKIIDLLDVFIVLDIEMDEYITIKDSSKDVQDDYVYKGIHVLNHIYGDLFDEFEFKEIK